HLDQATAKSPNSLNHVVDGNMVPARECVFAVAPGTSHRATCQPDKRTRAAGMCGLALDRMKNFSNAEHWEDSRFSKLDCRFSVIAAASEVAPAPADEITGRMSVPPATRGSPAHQIHVTDAQTRERRAS